MATKKKKGIVADVVDGVEAVVGEVVGTKKKARKPAKKAPKTTPNPSAVDSRGRTFDRNLHAHIAGVPQMDSTGAFIPADAHYNAPAQHHYGDTYRHAPATEPAPAAPAEQAKKYNVAKPKRKAKKRRR